MSGYDAPFHLAEECANANIASPRAIVMTAQLGLYLGWAIILVIVYTVKNIPDVVASNYGQPFGSLCLQVLGPRAGLALFSLNIIAQFFVGQGCTITATRVVFAFARDGALPGSKWWRQVDKRTKTPVLATWGVLAVSGLLGLLMFASPVAIGAIFSIGMKNPQQSQESFRQDLPDDSCCRCYRSVHVFHWPSGIEAFL